MPLLYKKDLIFSMIEDTMESFVVQSDNHSVVKSFVQKCAPDFSKKCFFVGIAAGNQYVIDEEAFSQNLQSDLIQSHQYFKNIHEANTIIWCTAKNLSPIVIDALDEFLSQNNTYHQLPFGGKQLVIFGDFIPKKTKLKKILLANKNRIVKNNQLSLFQSKSLQKLPLSMVDFQNVIKSDDTTITLLFQKMNIHILQKRINELIWRWNDYYVSYQKANWETLGKSYLQEAIRLCYHHQFNNAYKYFRRAYQLLTCDCSSGSISGINKIKNSIPTASHFDCEIYKLNFINAFIHYYLGNYTKALSYIENFIQHQKKDELGFYIQGKILLGLKKHYKALKSFQKAYSLKATNRSLYRIGRTKEENLRQNGIKALKEAFLANPSSNCANYNLLEIAQSTLILNEKFSKYHQENINPTVEFFHGVQISAAITQRFQENGIEGIQDYLDFIEKEIDVF